MALKKTLKKTRSSPYLKHEHSLLSTGFTVQHDLRIAPQLARFANMKPLKRVECEQISDNRVSRKSKQFEE